MTLKKNAHSKTVGYELLANSLGCSQYLCVSVYLFILPLTGPYVSTICSPKLLGPPSPTPSSPMCLCPQTTPNIFSYAVENPKLRLAQRSSFTEAHKWKQRYRSKSDTVTSGDSTSLVNLFLHKSFISRDIKGNVLFQQLSRTVQTLTLYPVLFPKLFFLPCLIALFSTGSDDACSACLCRGSRPCLWHLYTVTLTLPLPQCEISAWTSITDAHMHSVHSYESHTTSLVHNGSV